MNSDKKTLSKLSSLSDNELRGLIYDISNALNADKGKVASFAGDMGKVRAALDGISEQDAKKLIDKAGKEKAEKIYEALKRREG